MSYPCLSLQGEQSPEQKLLMVTHYWSGLTLSDALVMLLAVGRVATRHGVLSAGPTLTVESFVLVLKSTSTMISLSQGSIMTLRTLQSCQWLPQTQLQPLYARLPLSPTLALQPHQGQPHTPPPAQPSVGGCRHGVHAAALVLFLWAPLHFLHQWLPQLLLQGEVPLCTLWHHLLLFPILPLIKLHLCNSKPQMQT